MKISQILKENYSPKREYGCVMLYFSFPQIKNIQSQINSLDIYDEDGFGLENKPHCTLLYGLHPEVTLEQVQSIIDDYTFSTYDIYNPSLFKKTLYDVLKFNVKGDNLKQINKELKKYPYTNEYKDYIPHLTIGYLESGEGDKYVELLKGEEYILTPTHVVYSTPNNEQHKIKINLKKE